MPIEPAEKAPSVYQPLGADAPVPKRQQRVANRGRAARKSILQPLTSRVQGASSPHRTVRLAMYGVLLAIAMLLGAQAWRSDHAEAVRQADAEIIQVAAEQGALMAHMGTLAMTRMAPGLDAGEQYRALAEVLAQAQSKALRLEALLRAQADMENQAPEAVAQSVHAWKQNRERLWARAQAVLAQRGVEETAWSFRPTALIGVYQWPRPQGDITYLRFAFGGELGDHHADRKLDAGILRAVWMTPEEIRASADRHRSPLVWQCVADCLAGRRYPLELITHHG